MYYTCEGAPSSQPPKVRSVTAILKLRLRATLESGTFLPPLQLLNLMAKTSMDRYHYLPKKDPATRHTLGRIQPRVSPQRCSVRLRRKMHVTHTKYTYGQTQNTRSMRTEPSARPATVTPNTDITDTYASVHVRTLHNGESDDPCKMTYSIMAFFSRPCSSCKARAKKNFRIHAKIMTLTSRK